MKEFIFWIIILLVATAGIAFGVGRLSVSSPNLCKNNDAKITLSYGGNNWHTIRHVKLDCTKSSATIKFGVDH